MIRILSLAAVAAVVAGPAIAADAVQSKTETAPAVSAYLSDTAAALQARKHLVSQGYINVSTLEKDSRGLWTGTATKDGKTTIVAIKLPVVPAVAPSN
ncbi:MAG: hypothetical protein ABL897_02445 [Hyphomicrobium sp.]